MRENSSPPRSLIKEPNWTALLQEITSGDQAALAEFYDATSPMVFGLALRILNERAAAEDAVVEVYMQVWTQAITYEPQRGAPLAWLLTLTRSRAIDLLRARTRVQAVELREASDGAPSAALDPEASSVAAEQQRFVRRALEGLSDDQRQVIELAYFAGLSHTEIAARLGQPLGTVKTRIRTGMIRLRELLDPLITSLTTVMDKGGAG